MYCISVILPYLVIAGNINSPEQLLLSICTIKVNTSLILRSLVYLHRSQCICVFVLLKLVILLNLVK